MSYDNFQQNIEKKISKYKQKVGENYYTYYYYQGLDLLDKYIFNLANDNKIRNSERVSSLMRKAKKSLDSMIADTDNLCKRRN